MTSPRDDRPTAPGGHRRREELRRGGGAAQRLALGQAGRGARPDGRERRRQVDAGEDPHRSRAAGRAGKSSSAARRAIRTRPPRRAGPGSCRSIRSRRWSPTSMSPSNLRLTGTPMQPFLEWVRELGIADLDLRETARHIPLAVLRILDLARALAIAPDVLLLDEMTAALPANLAERVLDVVRRQAQGGPVRHLHLAPAPGDIGALRPRHGAARRRDRGRRRHGAGRRGADRGADARRAGREDAACRPARHRGARPRGGGRCAAPQRAQPARRDEARGRVLRPPRRRGAGRGRPRGTGPGRTLRRPLRVGEAVRRNRSR